MEASYYVADFGDPGLAIIIDQIRAARQDIAEKHFHRYRPGHSLDRQAMLYCDCGSQVNCSQWKSAVGAGFLYWNQVYLGLQVAILRDRRGER